MNILSIKIWLYKNKAFLFQNNFFAKSPFHSQNRRMTTLIGKRETIFINSWFQFDRVWFLNEIMIDWWFFNKTQRFFHWWNTILIYCEIDSCDFWNLSLFSAISNHQSDPTFVIFWWFWTRFGSFGKKIKVQHVWFDLWGKQTWKY